jgi:hypothetical protein
MSTTQRSYLVECYWPSVDEGKLAAAAGRADAAAEALRSNGHDIRLLWSVLVCSEETVFYLFDGEESDVRAVSEQAGVPFERVLESLLVDASGGEGKA